MAKKYLPLIRITTPTDSRVHLVDRSRFTLGRAPDAEVILLSASVSRKHLLVELKEDQIFIEDLQSPNGTFLNDSKLDPKQKYPVVPGAVIRLGTSVETISFEVIDRPVEFDKFKDYLPQFNENIQSVIVAALKNTPQSASPKPAQDVPLTAETAKAAEALLLRAQKEAQELIQAAKDKATAESQAVHLKAQEQLKKYGSEKLAQINEELQRKREESSAKINQEVAERRQTLLDQVPQSVRESLHSLKVQAQVEADQILQAAHGEALRLRQDSRDEAEKQKLETLKRTKNLQDEAEVKASKIVSDGREVAEQMRQKSRSDTDSMMQTTRAKCQNLLTVSEASAQEILSSARMKAEQLVKKQQMETDRLLSDLQQEIETKGLANIQNLTEAAETQNLQVRNALDLEITQARDLFDKKIAADLSAHESQLMEAKNLANLQIKQQQEKAQTEFDAIKGETDRLTSEKSKIENSIHDGLKQKSDLETNLKALQEETALLKQENKRQAQLSRDLAQAEANLKSLELNAAQQLEKNQKTEKDLELLKEKTFEELAKTRKEEQKKVTSLLMSRAVDLADRIEKIIVSEINQLLPEALEGPKLHSVSQKVGQELKEIFCSETFIDEKMEPSQRIKMIEKKPVTGKRWFRWAAAAAVSAGIFGLIRLSPEAVKQQMQFTEGLIEKQKKDNQYNPAKNKDYRQSYSDNVLFMDQYVEMKMDSHIQDEWALNLNEFFVRDLKLSEESMVRFIGLESALIKRLVALRGSIEMKYLEEGLARMKDSEAAEKSKMLVLLKTERNYEKLRLREKIFLSQVKAVPLRVPADSSNAHK